jgi:hypothetical protein
MQLLIFFTDIHRQDTANSKLILGQLGNYKQVLVKGKTILRLKGIKMWGFETPLQADVYGCL